MALSEPTAITIGPYEVAGRPSGDPNAYLARRPTGAGRGRLYQLHVTKLPEGGERDLAREVELCARLRHPAIPQVVDFFQWKQSHVLVFEHVDGIRLSRLLPSLERDGERLPDGAIWYLGLQTVGALARAHGATDAKGAAAPIIHGQLAPEHVLVSWEGRVLLVGLGLPTMLDAEAKALNVEKGPFRFAAPELRAGRRLTPGADVYAAALMLWSLLTGRAPPQAGERLPPLRTVRKDVPDSVAGAIDLSLEPSPGLRKIRCVDLERELRRVTNVAVGKAELRDSVEMMRALLGLWSVAPPPIEPWLVDAGTAEDGATAGATPRPSTGGPEANPMAREEAQRAAKSMADAPGRGTAPSAGVRPVERAAAAASIKRSSPDVDLPAVPAPAPESKRAPRAAPRPTPQPAPQDAQSEPGGATASAAPSADGRPSTPRGEQRGEQASRSNVETGPAQAGLPPRVASLGIPAAATPPPATPTTPDAPASTGSSGSSPANPPDAGTGGALGTARRRRRTALPIAALAVAVVAALWVAWNAGILARLTGQSPRVTPSPTAAPSAAPDSSDGLAPGSSVSAAVEAPSATPGPDAAPPVEHATDAGGREPNAGGAPPATLAAAGGGDGSELLTYEGYLIVRSSVQAEVFVQGKHLGPTNTRLRSRCHQKFVRLGTLPGPKWLGGGVGVRIGCRSVTEIAIEPDG